jgi:hypothetical protein
MKMKMDLLAAALAKQFDWPRCAGHGRGRGNPCGQWSVPPEQPHPREELRKDQCAYCCQEGHWKNECPHWPRWSELFLLLLFLLNLTGRYRKDNDRQKDKVGARCIGRSDGDEQHSIIFFIYLASLSLRPYSFTRSKFFKTWFLKSIFFLFFKTSVVKSSFLIFKVSFLRLKLSHVFS